MKIRRRRTPIGDLKAMRFGERRNSTVAHVLAAVISVVWAVGLGMPLWELFAIHPGVLFIGLTIVSWFLLELVDASDCWTLQVERGVLSVESAQGRSLLEAPLHEVDLAVDRETLEILAPGEKLSLVSRDRTEDLHWLLDAIRHAREAFGSPADVPAELRTAQRPEEMT
ncbi:MAG: hypothetical protein KC656_24185 [Myxococcales bacterium]|nr:hypothetical protein [Myxococcales bacterium]